MTKHPRIHKIRSRTTDEFHEGFKLKGDIFIMMLQLRGQKDMFDGMYKLDRRVLLETMVEMHEYGEHFTLCGVQRNFLAKRRQS